LFFLTGMHYILSADTSDEALLQQFKQTGSQQVLASLYTRYTELVYGVCMKYLKDQGLAKDAVMDIYHHLLAKLPLHEVENFKNWLYTVSKNHCLTQLRQHKKKFTIEFSPALMQSEDFSHLDSVLDKEDEFMRLENCIKKLPGEQKTGIELFYLENKCYNEIAEITGHDWGKVRSLIQNGRRNLKICMEKNG
jgi:RNA polymerase sigma factor (sigma-70 family)